MNSFLPSEPSANSEMKEVAEWRWKGVVGFSTHPGLSPLAKLLGVRLISIMNSRTRECYPSEVRLAAELCCSRRGLQVAKAELRDHGLIDWETPMGPRGGAFYTFNFERLEEITNSTKVRGDNAVDLQTRANMASSYMPNRRREAANASPKVAAAPLKKVVATPVVGEVECANDEIQSEVRFANDDIQSEAYFAIETKKSGRKAHFSVVQSALSSVQSEVECAYMAKRTSLDTIQDIIQDKLSIEHDIAAGVVGDEGQSLETSKPQDQEATKPAAKFEKPRFRFPKLLERFGSDELIASKIRDLPFHHLDDAARKLAMQGPAAAARFLKSHGIPLEVETLQ